MKRVIGRFTLRLSSPHSVDSFFRSLDHISSYNDQFIDACQCNYFAGKFRQKSQTMVNSMSLDAGFSGFLVFLSYVAAIDLKMTSRLFVRSSLFDKI